MEPPCVVCFPSFLCPGGVPSANLPEVWGPLWSRPTDGFWYIIILLIALVQRFTDNQVSTVIRIGPVTYWRCGLEDVLLWHTAPHRREVCWASSSSSQWHPYTFWWRSYWENVNNYNTHSSNDDDAISPPKSNKTLNNKQSYRHKPQVHISHT